MIEIFSHIPSEFVLERKIFRALCRSVKEYGSLPWSFIPNGSGSNSKDDAMKKARFYLMRTFGDYKYDPNDYFHMVITCFHWESLYHAILISQDAEICHAEDKNILEDEGLFDKSIPVWKKWVEDITATAKTDPFRAMHTLQMLQCHIGESTQRFGYVIPSCTYFNFAVEYIKSNYLEGIC